MLKTGWVSQKLEGGGFGSVAARTDRIGEVVAQKLKDEKSITMKRKELRGV
jgi:hypothetical protein